MAALQRTSPSFESTKPRNANPHSLSSATAPGGSRKSRSAEPDTTNGHVGRASLSMPPPASKSIPLQFPSRRQSKASDSSLPVGPALQEASGSHWTKSGCAIDDAETAPVAEGGRATANGVHNSLHDLSPYSARTEAETESHRMSFSSLYSLGSAIYNGARSTFPSGPSSVAGSEVDVRSDGSLPGATTATSSLSVTASTHNGGLSFPSSQHGVPREQNTATPSISTPTVGPVHPPPSPQSASMASGRQLQTVMRSRSRTSTQRRISGSTAASSASPGSRDSEARRPPIGTIGVCALDLKARSKPSRNILNRLIQHGEFEVKIFGDKVILDEEVENWPVCDFLISFFSDGFPLEKAVAYARLRKPFCVNDLPMQTVLWDRRLCLRILDKLNVPTPRRVEVNRDGGPRLPSASLAQALHERTGLRLEGPEDGTGGGALPPKTVELLDDGDTLYVDGVLLKKPFVEKPVSGENHNINIYYPRSHGGGGRRLFRKINNKSSEFDRTLDVPRAILEPGSSYLYEQFLRVDNAEDVKAYTVGPDYCHAETRRSPVVDGVVKRNPNGKEIRYVTSLNRDEASMASRISEGFGQRVCGFDLLRAGSKSYVIDVNGWSFVKDNNDYYDKCAHILRQMFIREKRRREGWMIPFEREGHDKPWLHRQSAPTGHRAALKSILRSPSMSKLTSGLHAHVYPQPSPSPDKGSSITPTASSSSVERSSGVRLPKIPLSRTESPSPAASEPVPGEKARKLSTSDAQAAAVPPPASKAQWKLKGMVAVIRHADRTPKQKFKFTFHTKPFVDLLKGHQEEVLLIGEAALQSVRDAVDKAFEEREEEVEKLAKLKDTLDRKFSWPGTKVQIKPMFRKRKKEEILPGMPADEVKSGLSTPRSLTTGETSDGPEDHPQKNDPMAGVVLSRIAAAENNLILDKLQLIIKWGGEPTHSARYQAQDLGENMRNDLLLMNRDIIEDISVFSSSERRVTTSAQIFASTFLDRTDIPSDFISVRKDLLDDSNAAKDEMDKVKKKLKSLLREGTEPPPHFAWPKDMPEPFLVVRNVVELMKFHRKVLNDNYAKLPPPNSTAGPVPPALPQLVETASKPSEQKLSQWPVNTRWCAGEDYVLFKERWEKLFKEFCDEEKVDPSKISELYDTMKFDALHNRAWLEWAFTPADSVLLEEKAPVPAGAASQPTSGDTKIVSQTLSAHETNPPQRPQTTVPDRPVERSNIASRIGLRRRSELPTQQRPTFPEYPHESYFALFTGTGTVKSSRAKMDARLTKLRELYRLCKVLFDYIGPQEYGILNSEKLEIGLLTSLPLLQEIVKDLEEVQASESPKSYFYFTKESHIYTLLNCILEGGIKTKIERNAIPELDYLSQICFELYESQNTTPEDEPDSFNYSIRITLSPGCHTFDPLDVQLDSKHCIGFAPRRSLTAHHDWKEILETLRAKFHTVKLPKSFVAINLSEKVPQAFGIKNDSSATDS